MKRSLVAAMLAAIACNGNAQEQSAKPVRFLVGYAPGGSVDITARIVAEAASVTLKQPIVIENRAGGVGLLAITALRREPADGNTVLITPEATLYQPMLHRELDFDAMRDMLPLGILTNAPIVLASHPGTGEKSIAELISRAKAQPGQMVYALPAATGTPAVAAAVFFNAAGIKLTAVPYKGGASLLADLIGGQVPLAVLGVAALGSHTKSGRVRLLAVTSKARSRLLPEVPALAELGYPNMDMTQWFGAMVAAGTPPATVTRLSTALMDALKNPTVIQKLGASGLEIVGAGPDEMSRRMAVEMKEWARTAVAADVLKN